MTFDMKKSELLMQIRYKLMFFPRNHFIRLSGSLLRSDLNPRACCFLLFIPLLDV